MPDLGPRGRPLLPLVRAGDLIGLTAADGHRFAFCRSRGRKTLARLRARGPATSILLVCATRFGILSMMAAWIAGFCLLEAPLTLDFSRWYAGRAMFDLLLLAALAVWGFQTSLAGRPAFGEVVLDEEDRIRAKT